MIANKNERKNHIIDERSEWKALIEIINYIWRFMTHQKIVKASGVLFNSYSQHNGIPQGHSSSVILSLIAYCKLNSVPKKDSNTATTAADNFNSIIKNPLRRISGINWRNIYPQTPCGKSAFRGKTIEQKEAANSN